MITNMEIWKDVVGYEGIYEVSNYGRIKSLQKRNYKNILAQRCDRDGYNRINLSNNGVVKTHSVHRLVANAFIPNPLNKSVINHKDCNPSNNNISNLEWVTQRDNQMYSRALGRYKECDTKSSQRFIEYNKQKRFKDVE